MEEASITFLPAGVAKDSLSGGGRLNMTLEGYIFILKRTFSNFM